jgi:hypothetical protein
MPYSTLSNWPSFTSLLCDLHDDDTCTTCHRYFASFEVKIGNPSSTCFAMKQAIGCRCVSSRRLHPLIDFEAQIDKPPPTCFWGTNQETIAVILMPKLPNRQHWFSGPNQKTVAMVLRLNREIHDFVSSTCMIRIAHGVTRPPDRLAIEYPTCAWLSPIFHTKSPTTLSILVVIHHVASVTHLHITRQVNTFLHTE